MERQLPLVDIAGDAFFVDVLHEELRQKDNRRNRISFNVFYQDKNGYTFLYDRETKNAPENIDKITEGNSRYQWITLPALMELDLVGIALKYDIPLEVLCPELKADKSIGIFDEDGDEDEYEEMFG